MQIFPLTVSAIDLSSPKPNTVNYTSQIIDPQQLMQQVEQMRKEIEELKGLKVELKDKDRQIYNLEKKIQSVSQERNKLRHYISTNTHTYAGNQPGLQTSTSNANNSNTTGQNNTHGSASKKKVDISGGGVGSAQRDSGKRQRSYAKPFQQLVSHIK